VLVDGCRPSPQRDAIQDAPLTIREVRHVIVEAIKAGDDAKVIDNEEEPEQLEHRKPDADKG
jgi:hypothetical protein